MSKFDELKKLAEAATPGPWMRLFGERTVYDRMEDGCRGNAIVRADGPAANNLQFIAAANPVAILELLAIQAQLVEALKQAKEFEQHCGGTHLPAGAWFRLHEALVAALVAAGEQS